MRPPVFRFAPSPNGYMHPGNAYSALLNQKRARQVNGRLLLRIEDIDITRNRPEFEQSIYEDLEWLGIEWERPVRRQSEHFSTYDTALKKLDEKGLIYPAFLSRKEIAAHAAVNPAPWPTDPHGSPLYPSIDRELDAAIASRRIAEGEDHAFRLNMQKALSLVPDKLEWLETSSGETVPIAADPAKWGDVILARKDVPTSYHLSVTVDDWLQGVTHIVRGTDLFHATSVHRLLQHLLGFEQPVYHHHPLISSNDGPKLSKSRGDRSLKQLRLEGVTAAQLRASLGFD